MDRTIDRHDGQPDSRFGEEHIRALARGDRRAFLALYESFFPALCYFARSFTDTTQSEDIVQEVFCRLFDNPRHFNNISSLKSYLYGAVRNGCLNYARDEKRRRSRELRFIEQMNDEKIFFDHIVESEVFRQMQRLLEELPPQCRNIFERTLEGATSEQIAQALGLSVETVKTQRKKAKRILRERYAMLYRRFGILL